MLASLGVADAELILEATDALIAGEPKDALLAVQKLAESGRDYEQFMRDLSAHLRHLLVTQIVGEVPDSFAVTAQHPERLAEQAEALRQGEVLRAIDLLAAAIGGREGGLGAAAAARGRAAEGHPAAGRPVAPGADVPDRPARGAARRRRTGGTGAAPGRVAS